MTLDHETGTPNPFAAPRVAAPSAVADLAPIDGRARAVAIGLIAVIVTGVALAVAEQAYHLAPSALDVDDGTSALPVLLALAFAAVGVGSVAAHVTTVVAWCFWSYRIARNLHRDDPSALGFTPGWVVGWWFVPFANLFKPYQVTRALFQASSPTGELPRAPDHLIGWWIVWVAGNVSANFAMRVADTPAAPAADLISSILGIVGAALALRVVADLTRTHQAWIDERSPG